jgi:GMP synthase-like glutamine amidotransferase
MLGGTVSPAKDWELSLTTITLTREGKSLFATADETIQLHQMHKDKVTRAPQGAHIWGSSEHTEIQGLVVPGRLFTTQGHLGYNETSVRENIEHRKERGMVDEEVADEAHETAHMEHDGERVASAILRFFSDRESGHLRQETDHVEERIEDSS